MATYFRHLVLDDFLSNELHDELLDYALSNEARFLPTKVYGKESLEPAVERNFRCSWRCEDGLGPIKQPFKDAIRSRFSALVDGVGLGSFEIAYLELELIAHRNGSFFNRHIDTFTRSQRDIRSTERVVSTVYYFHKKPKRFSGGELALAPLGQGELRLVEPCSNRLVAFPSIAPHEVKSVVCEGDDFSHARFAVNCWLNRPRRVA